MRSPLHGLSRHGQRVWIDFLSRELLESGELERMIQDDAVSGVTSNPTIFAKALSAGNAYDVQIAELASRDRTPKEIFLHLAASDLEAACDALLPVWQATAGRDGYASVEVDPHLADDTPATVHEASLYHELIARPNLLVKIPATEAGLPAIEEMIARGRSINVTLIFSLERYAQVAEAYIRGLERLVEAGGDPARVHSVASFFVSRVDTEADRRLEQIGTEPALVLRGELGIANAKFAYEQYKRTFAGERWQRLALAGATKQRCLWASTSTKNPGYRDTRYVEELIGPETVSTMPQETLGAFRDHGRVAPTLTRGIAEAHGVFRALDAVGLDYAGVVGTLEREGVQKFVASFEQLLAEIEAKRARSAEAA
jgi:transaldolase